MVTRLSSGNGGIKYLTSPLPLRGLSSSVALTFKQERFFKILSI